MMEMTATSDRDFWHGVLSAGGFTEIPRWSSEPTAGVARHREPIPADLVSALHRVADESAVSLSSVLLGAHLAVLAALSGEDEVTTGYLVAPDRPPLPLRQTTAPGSWRSLVLQAYQNESELLWHKDFPVADLQRELGLAEPAFEVLFDPAASDATGADMDEARPGIVLWLGFSEGDGQLLLWYRRDALDAAAAARIAGYHATALRLLAAHPEEDHRRHTLLSTDEVRSQLEDFAGPERELPDRRVHELFEEQARAHPEAVAAEFRDRRLTYRELNSRANRLARVLVSRGVPREGVVAVVSERNLDWMAAVLAVFKAGAVYLPIEPHFPADRIARTLARAGCTVVLSERGGSTTLDAAVQNSPAIQRIFLDDDTSSFDGDDPGITVDADQLAYIYFTSGSTGEPKGAMCEHAGMLNHLFAKIDDLEIDDASVVAQVAPQCFDISLWQLVSAVLVGGRTLLIEQDVILDVQRFVDTVVAGKVTVLQVVPSYLEVVLSYLEQHPRDLPDLRYVSVTGEALKKELTERWFAAKPHIKLVNAYGLTETSDDTNHEVMSVPPTGDRVPLGRPVNNVHVYVLDSEQRPVPLGAPGEIAFSGVCVGRGYINDPERTRMAFLSDPLREGRRLYRAGDFGRWRPDGKLEYLGRRDSQVKIAGFRIEIGEIENALLGAPGVADGAVVVTGLQNQNKRLVAFYSAASALPADVLHSHLATSLPAYMVPSAFHWRDRLPLTANGKIDRKKLGALAAELVSGDPADEASREPVGTPTETRLRSAFAAVLGIPEGQIGRDDSFFDKGGTSLSAVKLAINLNRIVSLADITRHPVLGDLAHLIDAKAQTLAPIR
jgi:amino acid adenylation domain-containing protein